MKEEDDKIRQFQKDRLKLLSNSLGNLDLSSEEVASRCYFIQKKEL